MRERNLQNAQGGWLHFIMSVLPWRKRSQRKLWMIPPEAENSLWRNLNKRRSRMLPCSPEKMRNWNRRTAKCPTAEKLRKAWRRAINSVAMTRKTVPGILWAGHCGHCVVWPCMILHWNRWRNSWQRWKIFCQITIMMSPNICRIWNLMKRIFAVQRIVWIPSITSRENTATRSKRSCGTKRKKKLIWKNWRIMMPICRNWTPSGRKSRRYWRKPVKNCLRSVEKTQRYWRRNWKMRW